MINNFIEHGSFLKGKEFGLIKLGKNVRNGYTHTPSIFVSVSSGSDFFS